MSKRVQQRLLSWAAVICSFLGSLRPATAIGAPTARVYTLFSAPGVQSERYDEFVRQIQADLAQPEGGRAPVILTFSNGVSFPIMSVLGKGSATLVLEIPGYKSLRIPLRSGETFWRPGQTYLQKMTDYLEAYRMMSTVVPMPKVHEELSFAPEYLVVEKVDVKFTLGAWLFEGIQVSPEEEAAIEDALVDLARRTAAYRQIGDFAPKNLVWDGRQIWGLDGKKTGNIKADKIDDPSPLLLLVRSRPDLKRRVEDAVTAARRQLFCGEWMAQ